MKLPVYQTRKIIDNIEIAQLFIVLYLYVNVGLVNIKEYSSLNDLHY